MDVSPARINEICAAFSQQRIAVIGDVMLDHFIVGDARRISPEAPIPIVNFLSETYCPGGAANVARNLAALGCRVDLFGVVGDDVSADLLATALDQNGIAAAGLIREPQRPTTVKTRVTAQRHQIVRLDRETDRSLEPHTSKALAAAWNAALPGTAAVILADYAKGVIDQALVDAVIGAARPLNIPIFIDPKPSRRLSMRGCTALTPNRKETFELARMPEPDSIDATVNHRPLYGAIARIQAEHAPAELLVTLSEAGLLLVEHDKEPRHIPTFARQVFDVSGAGDTVIATFALARVSGATPLEAAIIANHSAGIVVGKIGTAAITAGEILDRIDRDSPIA